MTIVFSIYEEDEIAILKIALEAKGIVCDIFETDQDEEGNPAIFYMNILPRYVDTLLPHERNFKNA